MKKKNQNIDFQRKWSSEVGFNFLSILPVWSIYSPSFVGFHAKLKEHQEAAWKDMP